MKTIQAVRIGFVAILFLIFCPLALNAEPYERFENRAQDCFNNYLELTEEKLSAGDEAESDLIVEAEKNLRCTVRYQSKRPYILAAAKTLDEIKAEIKEIKKKIKKLKRKAERTGDYVKALQIWGRIGKLEIKLEKLKKRRRQGECPPKKTTITMVFENNTDHTVGVWIYNQQGQVALLGKRKSGKILTYSMSLQQLRNIVGENATTVEFSLKAIINGNLSETKAVMNIKKVPKRKPCAATARFEIFNKDFPVKKAEYWIIGVKAGSGVHFFIGLEINLVGRTPYSFAGGGMDNTSQVKWDRLAGPYSSLAAAQQSFCRAKGEHQWWRFTTCHDCYNWAGTCMWACEPSVRSAINQYCSN